MTRCRFLIAGCLAATLVVGCLPGPTTPSRVPGKVNARPSALPSVTPSVSGATSPTPTPTLSLPPVVLPSPGGGVVSNNGASLTGTIRLPATLISDKGLGIISNNGSNWRVLATTTEVAVPKARVHLLDAALRPVLDGDGSPVTTVADETGTYGFTVALPPMNLVVAFELPENGGRALAIAPTGTEKRTADLNFVSTLTTSYILDQYVKGQQDPLATLQKLPGDVEKVTREKAAAAFAGGETAVPDALTTEKLVATVNQLRQKDSAFNAQMETVKKLLIVAGQSNLGSGSLANRVDFGSVSSIAVGPEGDIYWIGDQRLWRLKPDGVLEAKAGRGFTPAGPLTGPLDEPQFLVDNKGRWLVASGTRFIEFRAYRQELDGTYTTVVSPETLWNGSTFPRHRFAMTGVEDELLVLTEGELFTVVAGQPPVKKFRLDLGENVFAQSVCSRPLNNKVVVVGGAEGKNVYMEMDLTTGQATPWFEVAAEYTFLDNDGNVFYVDTQGNLMLRERGKAESRLVTTKVTSIDSILFWLLRVSRFTPTRPLALGRDGFVYASAETAIYRYENGQPKLIAGKAKLGTAVNLGDARDYSFPGLSGVGFMPNGDMIMADSSHKVLLRVDGKGQLSRVAGWPDDAHHPATGLAVDERLTDAGWVKVDATGNIYFFDTGYTVKRVTTDGRIDAPFGTTRLYDLACGKGAVYLLKSDATRAWISEWKGGQERELVTLPSSVRRGLGQANLAVGPDGAVYLSYGYTVGKWTADGGFGFLTESEELFTSSVFGGRVSLGLAVDGIGRVYVPGNNQIRRYTPATQQWKVIVGQDGTHYTDTTIDNGVANPAHPAFNAQGDLVFADVGNRQIKRVPAAELN